MKLRKVLIVDGLPGAGKSTAVEVIKEIIPKEKIGAVCAKLAFPETREKIMAEAKLALSESTFDAVLSDINKLERMIVDESIDMDILIIERYVVGTLITAGMIRDKTHGFTDIPSTASILDTYCSMLVRLEAEDVLYIEVSEPVPVLKEAMLKRDSTYYTQAVYNNLNNLVSKETVALNKVDKYFSDNLPKFELRICNRDQTVKQAIKFLKGE